MQAAQRQGKVGDIRRIAAERQEIGRVARQQGAARALGGMHRDEDDHAALLFKCIGGAAKEGGARALAPFKPVDMPQPQDARLPRGVRLRLRVQGGIGEQARRRHAGGGKQPAYDRLQLPLLHTDQYMNKAARLVSPPQKFPTIEGRKAALPQNFPAIEGRKAAPRQICENMRENAKRHGRRRASSLPVFLGRLPQFFLSTRAAFENVIYY